MMNTLQRALSDICKTHRVTEKMFLVPSFSLGHQITESLVRSGAPYLNLHIKTPLSLAHEIVGLDLARESSTYLPGSSVVLVIEDLFTDLQSRKTSYFHGLGDKEGIVRALANSVRELRMAGIAAAELKANEFLSGRKGEDLKELLSRYEGLLEERKLADSASVLSRAIAKLSKGGSRANSPLYLMLSNMPLTVLERRVLELLPGEKIILPHEVPEGLDRPPRYLASQTRERPRSASTNIERLPWLFRVEAAPSALDDDTIGIFHAVGRKNEVKEVFRRIAGAGIRSDAVEIICTSYGDYVQLIYDIGRKYEIAMTFGEGLPVSITRPGRAALGFIAWLQSDYQAVQLKRLIKGGVLALRPEGADAALVSSSMIAKILREAPIGWGRERYLPVLNDIVELCASHLKKAEEEGDDQEIHRKRIANARFLLQMVGDLFEMIPEPGRDGLIDLRDVCTYVSAFISWYARTADELDGEAKAAIIENLEEIQRLSGKRLLMRDALDRIGSAVRCISVGASGPAPGCLHVSSYHHGGFSGRSNTYIPGCDGQTLPGTIRQEPVMLDEERRRLSGGLSLSSDRLKESLYCFASLLASLRGEVTFSFPSFDVLENRDCAPSSVLLQVYRLASGEMEADYGDLSEDLGRPSGFIPKDRSIDVTDFWLERFSGPEGLKEADEKVFHCYPGLAHGLAAVKARQSDAVTEFDGKIGPDKDLDPRENPDLVMSASVIEMIAKCPYSYLLNYVLRVRPLEELVMEPDRWLPPQERGSLLHELFRKFMVALKERNEKPSLKKHLKLIQGMANDLASEYRRLVPPPGEAIFRQEIKGLLKAAEVFLKVEEEYCRNCTPEFFELPFGFQDEVSTRIGTSEPIGIPLGQGRSFRLRGRIDRIDRVRDGEYEVWDYKTGSPRSFKDQGRFDKGRNLQHGLYAIAAETILRGLMKDSGVTVRRSGYLFPTDRGFGRRISRDLDDKALKELLNALFDVLRNGAFISTNDDENCRYCDYSDVCGEGVTDQARLKAGNSGNRVLDAFRKVNEYE